MRSTGGATTVFLLLIFHQFRSSGQTFCTELDPTRIIFHTTFPGEFFGSPTIPTYCINTTSLSCSTEPLTPSRLTDGKYGNGSDRVDYSQFIAWNNKSRVTLTRSGATSTLNSVRTVNLFFYHDPALGIGLPEFIITGSTSETMPGATLPYTILGNQDLGASDAQVRNVTLALTQSIVGDANRFHIAFSLISGVQQFALSEVELCSDVAEVAAETLSVRLNSEPIQLVNGSTVLLPANRTGASEEAVIRLSCTVVNQGRFMWVWTLPDSVSSTTQQEILDGQLILDGTRTRVIEVPRSRESVGNYTCTASYATGTGLPASSVAEDFIIDVQLVLYPNKRTVIFEENDFVLLECILAGEISGTERINWVFNGQIITNSGRHNIFESNNILCAYGTCHQSQLQIRQAGQADAGIYTCQYAGLSDVILLMQLLSPAIPPASLPDPPPTQQTNTPFKSPEIPLIAGLTTAGFVLGLTVAVIVTVMCVVMIRRKSLMAQPHEQPIYDYVEPPNLPPERVKLEGNTAYGIIQPQPLEDLSATNQITLSETVETKGNEAYGQTGVLQLQENEAYQQREVLQLQENEAYEHTREVVIYL